MELVNGKYLENRRVGKREGRGKEMIPVPWWCIGFLEEDFLDHAC